VIVAFESAPWCSKNLWPFLLLKTIMGKADSFSSGGPGKGMYSRAYEHLMNVVPSVQKVASVHMPFSDSGLFGLHLGGNAESYQELVQLTLRELNLLQTLSADEVARGKLILKRGLIENMEQQAPLL
jgi:mitochondrial-processing peptidase subunit alpha